MGPWNDPVGAGVIPNHGAGFEAVFRSAATVLPSVAGADQEGSAEPMIWRSCVTVLCILSLVACSSAAPTPSPQTTATEALSTGRPPTGVPASDEPTPVDGGQATPQPGRTYPPDVPPPLPEPTISEPFGIGQSLYDPANIEQAVVSLLDVMGVEIVAADGTVLRAGADRGAGRITLTEDEVRGLIQMARDELQGDAGESGVGSVTVADTYDAVQDSLPADFSADDFAAAYDEAFKSQPDSLAAGVMLGMPITPETRLLRVQQWLFFVDGFPDAEELAIGASTGRRSTALAQQSGGNTLGAAAQNLPPAQSPVPGWNSREYAAVIRLLPTLAFRVPFTVTGGNRGVHEGHGRPGDTLQLTAQYRRPQDIVTNGGHVLIEAGNPGAGLAVKWNSYSPSTLSDHGQVSPRVGSTVATDGSGSSRVTYQLKQEPSNGRGEFVDEPGSLYAEVLQSHLIIDAYNLPQELLPLGLGGATRKVGKLNFQIAWHDEDYIKLKMSNPYDFTLDVPVGIDIMTLARIGTDSVEGTLTHHDDGTYRGTVSGETEGTADGTFQTPLAGSECHDHQSGTQMLYVVGTFELGMPAPDPSLYSLVGGSYAEEKLNLAFYPASEPFGNSTLCQPFIPFPGGGPHGQQAGNYLPFNDTRWSTPDVGYSIFLPADDPATEEENLVYKDKTQYHVSSPGGGGIPGVTSDTWWDVDVTVHHPEP